MFVRTACGICAASGCYNPEWEVHENQNSVGASQYSAAQSVQECLDYCGSQSNCVAADVDLTQQPPTCWPHFSRNALLDSNVFSQHGTNQYRLIERCVNTTGISGCRLIALITSQLAHNCGVQTWSTSRFWPLCPRQHKHLNPRRPLVRTIDWAHEGTQSLKIWRQSVCTFSRYWGLEKIFKASSLKIQSMDPTFSTFSSRADALYVVAKFQNNRIADFEICHLAHCQRN